MPCYVKKRSTHINNLYKYINSNTDTKYMLFSYLLTYIKQWIYKYNSYIISPIKIKIGKNKEMQTTSRSSTSYRAHIMKYLQL